MRPLRPLLSHGVPIAAALVLTVLWAAVAPAGVPLGAATAAAQPATAPVLRVAEIRVRGNKKVEDEAIKAALTTKVDGPFSSDRVRDDVQALWKMSFFE